MTNISIVNRKSFRKIKQNCLVKATLGQIICRKGAVLVGESVGFGFPGGSWSRGSKVLAKTCKNHQKEMVRGLDFLCVVVKHWPFLSSFEVIEYIYKYVCISDIWFQPLVEE